MRTFGAVVFVLTSFAAIGQGVSAEARSTGQAMAGSPSAFETGRAGDSSTSAGAAPGASLVNERAPEHAVTASPMTLAAMGLGVEYEHALGDLVAVFASLEGSLLWRGLGGQAGARIYPFGRPMDGVFLDAHGSAYRGRFAGEPYTQYGGGMLLGRSWTLEHGVLLSLGGGADVKQTEMERGGLTPSCVSTVCYDQALNASAQPNGLRVTPTVRAAIGYAF